MAATKTEPRSKRGRARYSERKLTPLEQIRVPGGGGPEAELEGAWGYYLRPEGATIRDALILYPNGGVPDIPDARKRGRIGKNASYYRERQGRKGFEYLGTRLTEEGVAKLVKTMEANRQDEILFVEDEIVDCEDAISNADLPQVREQAKKRKAQLQRRLEYLTEDLDQNALTEELNEIARAQMLANVDPNVLQVMKAMIGEVNENTAKAIAKFARRAPASEEPSGRRGRKKADAAEPTDVFEDGVDHIDVD